MHQHAFAFALGIALTFWLVPSCYTLPTVSEASSSGGSTGNPPMVDVACETSCSCDHPEGCRFGCGTTGCQPAECIGSSCEGICGFNNACDIRCDNSTCGIACLGAGCAMQCQNNSSCQLGCPAGGCTITCESGSNCDVDCNTPGNPCTINCSGGATATCKGNCVTTGCL